MIVGVACFGLGFGFGFADPFFLIFLCLFRRLFPGLVLGCFLVGFGSVPFEFVNLVGKYRLFAFLFWYLFGNRLVTIDIFI